MTKKNNSRTEQKITGKESFGRRLARIRKEKGYTQVELAKKMGIIQVLISDYERDKLRPYHDIITRFSLALDVSSDELLGLKTKKNDSSETSLKMLRRIKKIETLPPMQQKTLLRTIDTFLKGAIK